MKYFVFLNLLFVCDLIFGNWDLFVIWYLLFVICFVLIKLNIEITTYHVDPNKIRKILLLLLIIPNRNCDWGSFKFEYLHYCFVVLLLFCFFTYQTFSINNTYFVFSNIGNNLERTLSTWLNSGSYCFF